MGRKKKYSDEERLILGKCKVDAVYKMTKQMLGMKQDELKYTINLLHKKIVEIGVSSGKTFQEKEDEKRIVRSIIKNAKRIQSLRMLEEVDELQRKKAEGIETDIYIYEEDKYITEEEGNKTFTDEEIEYSYKIKGDWENEEYEEIPTENNSNLWKDDEEEDLEEKKKKNRKEIYAEWNY